MAVRKNISSKSNQGSRESGFLNEDHFQLTNSSKNDIIIKLRIDFQLP